MTRDSLLDSSVMIELISRDSDWYGWSQQATAEARACGRLVLNPVVIAEIAAGYADLDALDAAISADEFEREQLPWEAAFQAGQAFAEYRRRGGPRGTLLPNFLIGAHAATRGYRLITRDPRRYRAYFPGVEILTPEQR